MAWKVQNPKTGDIFYIEEDYDESTQTDRARDAAIAKGYIPVIDVRNPRTGDAYTVDDRTFDQALKKGYMPEEAYKSFQEVLEGRKERAKEQLKGARGQAIAAAKGFADVATFGFSDELVGAWKAATERGAGQDFLDAYKNHRDIDRALQEAAIEEAPIAYGAGAVGAIVPTLGATAIKAPTLGRAVATGAAEGAVGGAGAAREIEDIPQEATIGAGLGAGITGVAGGAIKGLGAIKSKATRDAIEDTIRRAPDLDEAADRALADRPRLDIEETILRQADTTDFSKFKESVDNSLISKFLTDKDRKVLNASSAEHNLLKRSISEAGEEVTPANLLQYKAFLKSQKMAEFVTDSVPGNRSFRELLKQEGDNFVVRQYRRALKEEAALQAVAESNLKNRLPQWSTARRLASLFSDVKPLTKSIDKRLGTSMEKTIDELSKKHNLYTVRLGDVLREVAQLRTATRKAGLSEQEVFRMLDSGKVENPTVKAWQSFFESMRKEAHEVGVPIDKRKNYVPYRRLSTVKYQRALADRAKELQEASGFNLRKLDEAEYSALENNKLFKELKNEVEFLRGGIKDAEDFSFKFSDILINPRANKSKLATDAFAAKARTGEIPDFVKDKETGNLAAKWVQSTFRHAAMRDGLAELRTVSKVANKAGDDFTHKYVTNLIEDIVGSRSDTLAAQASELADKFLIYAQRKASQAKNPIEKRLWEGTGYLPEIMNTMARQVYPNYIGLNPKSVLQNLAQPVLMNIPDIGYRSGLKAWTNSQVDMARILKEGVQIKLSPEMARAIGKRAGETIKTRSINMVMQNEGLLPKQWTGEMVDALKDSLKSNAVTDMSRAALDKYTNAMMAAFEKSEIYARGTSYFMGKRLAQDLFNNTAKARRFISELDSPAYQKSLTKALRAGNIDQFQNEMVSYLNAQNMFNYDRINMSAYGRYLGPMFSVFSKWPTSIAGRIIQQAADEGAIKGGKKLTQSLLAPFMTLAIVDHLTRPEDSQLYDRIVGRGGLSSWTPADSVSPLLEGGILQSPAFQSGGALAKALREEDKLDATYRWVNDFYATFGFGSGLLRFFGEDMPVYRGDDKPTGPKIERRLKSIEDQLN